jgi:hypothetical protein
VGPNKDRIQLPGRIVGADTLIPVAQRTGKAYVEVEIPEGLKLTRPIVSGSMVSVKDVPLISRKSVTLDGGVYYATVLENGVPQKRYINCLVHNSVNEAWVLQGLEPGDEIIID